MRRLALEILVATTLTIGAILALTPGVLANDVMVKGAFARASAVSTAKAGTVYMKLINHSSSPDRLLSVSTDVADSASLHESKMADDMASMDRIDGLDLPAGGEVELKPGGLHIMLEGLKAPLKKGDKVKLRLVFEQAGTVDVIADVGDVAEEHAHVDGSTGN